MSQPFALSCRGGLNVNLNQLELMRQPGFATELLNFEVDPDGGYRRINGFTQFGGGSTAKPNSANTILGLFVYADGSGDLGLNFVDSTTGSSTTLTTAGNVTATIADDKNLILKLIKKNETSNILWGTARSIINSAIIGVSEGFEKILEINGVGFRAILKGNI